MTTPAFEPPRDRLTNPSINFPQSEEEAFQALIHAVRRMLLNKTSPHVASPLKQEFTTDSGFGTERTQQQADWLNQQQALLRARLEDILDELDRRFVITDPTT
jgi:hypothetical protein